MKKLLSILLTVVMAVCLVNLNSGHVDAEDTTASIGYTINLKSDGSLVEDDTTTTVDPTIASFDSEENTLTIHKSITETANNKPLLSVAKTNVKIVIEGDITLTGAINGDGVVLSKNNIELNFEGDGFNTLKIINTGNGNGIKASGGISFTNLSTDITSTYTAIVFGVDISSTVRLDSASKVKAYTTDGSNSVVLACKLPGEPFCYSQKGHTATSSDMIVLEWSSTDGYYKALGNKINYVELNYIPLYEYTNSGWTEYHTENLYNTGDTVYVKNSSLSNITLTKNQASPLTLAPGESSAPGVNIYNNGSLVTLRDKKVNVTDEAPISCNGLVYGTDNYWYHGSNGVPSNKLDNATKLADYGIVKNDDGSYTFNKSLTTNSSYQTVKILAAVNIVLGNDISIVNTETSYPSTTLGIKSKDVKIDGQGHKLVLENTAIDAFSTNNSTTLKDIELIAQSNGSLISAFNGGDSIKLEGNCTIEANNTKYSAITFILNDFVSSGNIQKVGSATQKGQKEDSVHKSTYGVYVVGSGDATNAKYVRITNTPIDTPTTTSEPTVKDESCEKVIGPTWHWNNAKGVCEEYTLVRTNTR